MAPRLTAVLMVTLSVCGMTPEGSAAETSSPGSSPVAAPAMTWLEGLIVEAAANAAEVAYIEIDDIVDEIYAPILAGLPNYADFHYSLRGRAVELAALKSTRAQAYLQKRLFPSLAQDVAAGWDKVSEAFRAADLEILGERQAIPHTAEMPTVPQVTKGDTLIAGAALTGGAVAVALPALIDRMRDDTLWDHLPFTSKQSDPLDGGGAKAVAGLATALASAMLALKGEEVLHREAFLSELTVSVEDHREQTRAVFKAGLEELQAATVSVQHRTLRDVVNGENPTH